MCFFGFLFFSVNKWYLSVAFFWGGGGLHQVFIAMSRGHSAMHGLLVAVASLIAEHELWACGLSSCVSGAPVILAHGLISCSEACGIFPDKGSNTSPLHWQVDSLPLDPQGSPQCSFNLHFFNDVEHLFMCLLALCISFLNYLFKNFAHLKLSITV